MNTNIDDNELCQLLKTGRQEAPEHPFFTRKVMNRLPESKGKNYNWLMWAVYIAVLLVCASFWTYFGLTADLSQLLTFDNGKFNADHSTLLGFAMLVGITGFTVWQIYQLVSESDR